jgi:hypothetical protein
MLDSWNRNQSKPKKQNNMVHIVLIKQSKKTVLQQKKKRGKNKVVVLPFFCSYKFNKIYNNYFFEYR